MEAKSEFDKLMREAVAIKSAQLSQYRRKFDKWPQFHQAGLYYSESFASLRSSPLSDKLSTYETKKQEGTSLFQSSDFQQALHKYEEALTLFRWVKNRNDKWRNAGIEDDDLTVETVELTPEAIEMMVSLYLNIALCNIKLTNWSEAVQACDEALILDSNNVKALYRKSLALTLPAGSDLDDYRTAITLLNKALEIEPQNQVVRQKLIEFKKFLKEQKIKSKETFHSFFKKPAYADAEPEVNTSNRNEYEELMTRGQSTLKDLIANGKEEEAKKLEKNLKLMEQYKKKAIIDAKKKALDFNNPTEEMKANAKQYGLDLEDPMIKAELNKLKEKKGAKKDKTKAKSEGKPKGIIKTRPKPQIEAQEKGYKYMWWALGIMVIILAAYLYYPNEAELW